MPGPRPKKVKPLQRSMRPERSSIEPPLLAPPTTPLVFPDLDLSDIDADDEDPRSPSGGGRASSDASEVAPERAPERVEMAQVEAGTDDSPATEPGVATAEPAPGDGLTAPAAQPSGALAPPSGGAVTVANADSRALAVAVAAPRRVGEILVKAGRIDEQDVASVLVQQRTDRAKFGEILIARGRLDPSDVLWALSQQSGVARPPEVQRGSEELIVLRDPFSPAAENIRRLRTQLLAEALSPAAQPRRALALVSSNSGDGKTYLAANLALSLAQFGGRVMLIEANLRNPRLADVFSLDETMSGLSGVLCGQQMLRDAVVALPDLPAVHLLPAGVVPPNPVELLQQPAFSLLVSSLVQQYDHVLVDAPPFDAGADAQVVAERCGLVLALGRKGHTRMDALQSMLNQLRRVGVAIAGMVINTHQPSHGSAHSGSAR